jgi:hypothetical protein
MKPLICIHRVHSNNKAPDVYYFHASKAVTSSSMHFTLTEGIQQKTSKKWLKLRQTKQFLVIFKNGIGL